VNKTQKTSEISDQNPLQKSWSMTGDDVLENLDTDIEKGLSTQEAYRRQEKYGHNQLKKIQQRSIWDILADQLNSLIIYILLAAAIISYIRQAWVDGSVIVIVLIINTAIGFFTELKATRSIESLQEIDEVDSLVRRDGQEQRISARSIVPGDIIILNSGEIASADIRLLSVSRLQVDESALTGESIPVQKQVKPLGEKKTLQERSNMVFKGTSITSGEGMGIVVATGMKTEIGKISAMVESAGGEETPLEKRLAGLGKKLAYITLGIAAALIISGIFTGRDITLIIETAIALAIAAVPEGLVIVATVALSRGMWNMLDHNALVRNLSSVETLGTTNVICTDKTGTLTTGHMTVNELWLTSHRIHIKTEEKEPDIFSINGKTIKLQQDRVLEKAIQVAVLCNDARLNKSKDKEGHATGDPIEIALLEMGQKTGIKREELIEKMPEIKEVPFDGESKKMATVHETKNGYFVAVKGAPEAVLEESSTMFNDESSKLGDDERNKWMDHNNDMAGRGLRVLAVAMKTMDSADIDVYKDLKFLGLVGFTDPPRKGVKEVIRHCRDAGIRVIIITGDQPATARHIAREVGLIDKDDPDVISGLEFDDLIEEKGNISKKLAGTDIFARVSPKQKLDLVKLYQANGAIVAMTGDGVNDAPALKSADIGVAMGRRGTQVARETADMILQDDAFPTIVAAVEQGRVIFENIRKFIIYLLSGNVGEILAVGVATVVSAPMPLLPLQILYLNVLNDVFPALALGVSEGDPSVMGQPPRKKKESFITLYNWGEIICYGLLIGGNLLAVFFIAMNWLGLSNTEAVTISFLTISVSRLLHTFNMRNPGSGLFKNEITKNIYVWGAIALSLSLLLTALYLPFLADILKVTPLSLKGWMLVLFASFVPLVVGQIYVIFFKSRRGNKKS
jgi:P-type Ca2+ transporter type 2C